VEIAKKRKSLEERNEKRRAAGATEFVSKRKKPDDSAGLAVPEQGAHYTFAEVVRLCLNTVGAESDCSLRMLWP
jgi:hypothetical protein